MKKRLFALAAVVALFAASAVPAFAHDIPEAVIDNAQSCDPGTATVFAHVGTGIEHAGENAAVDLFAHLIVQHAIALCGPDILPG